MNLKCTQCGAEVPIVEDTQFLRCPYCETALYVEMDRTVLHFFMPPQVPVKDLPFVVQRKLSYLEVNDPVRVETNALVYFPFWRFEPPVGDSLAIPAAPTPVEDLHRLKVPAGDVKHFHDEVKDKAQITDPSVLLEDALPEAQARLESESVKFKSAALLHLPLYEIEYTCQGRKFTAAVEAVSGSVYGDDWPAAPQKEKDRVLGWIAFLAFALFLVEAALIPGWWLTAAAYVVTGVGLYYLALTTLRRMGW